MKSIKAMIEKNPSFGYRSLGFRHRIQALPSVALGQGLVHLYGCLRSFNFLFIGCLHEIPILGAVFHCGICHSDVTRKYPKQNTCHHQIARELANGHVKRARPQWHLEPASHGAQWIAYAGQPTQQTGFGAQFLKPDQSTHVVG